MDRHGQARTNTDGMVREYAISQDPLVNRTKRESCVNFASVLVAFVEEMVYDSTIKGSGFRGLMR